MNDVNSASLDLFCLFEPSHPRTHVAQRPVRLSWVRLDLGFPFCCKKEITSIRAFRASSNICRSPMAEIVFRHKSGDTWTVDSCGMFLGLLICCCCDCRLLLELLSLVTQAQPHTMLAIVRTSVLLPSANEDLRKAVHRSLIEADSCALKTSSGSSSSWRWTPTTCATSSASRRATPQPRSVCSATFTRLKKAAKSTIR